MRTLAALLVAFGLLWASPALAVIAAPTGIGATNAAGATSVSLSTTADAPVASTIFALNFTATAGTITATDTAGNSYTQIDFGIWTGAQHLRLFYSNNTGTDLPAPCTVTATETTTTLVVTAALTCASNDTFTSGMALSGTGITGNTSGSCTLVSGAATCTVTGGSTQASPQTVTVSSVIKISSTGTAGALGMTAAYTTGVATSTPVDVTGTIVTGTGTSTTTSTGTLGQANEIVLGVMVVATSIGYVGHSPFADLTSSTNCVSTTCVNWSYDIVASTGSVTYSPTWTTSRLFGAAVVTFKAAAGGGAAVCRRALTGVGC